MLIFSGGGSPGTRTGIMLALSPPLLVATGTTSAEKEVLTERGDWVCGRALRGALEVVCGGRSF